MGSPVCPTLTILGGGGWIKLAMSKGILEEAFGS